MTLIQTEPKKIYLGPNIAAMQGPCPTGFHVPSKDEHVALVAAMTALGIDTSNGNCMKTYMKMPFAGNRSLSSTVTNQSTSARYWSSTAYSVDNIYYLSFGLAGLNPQNANGRPLGYSVRPFKNTPVIPDSNWTTLYAGTGDAGIFHDIVNGLISLSSDGTNRITIADKNLGATTVYNDGDTLAESNCGGYFQWGNNYMFPFTGTVTTSSTKVDASTYGPGNYYSSSTFITVSASPYNWDSSNNDNLRGGVSGATKEIKRVTIRPNGTEKQIRPVIPYLCFTANTASSTVKLNKTGSPTAITLETSTDGNTWTTYTFGNTITLSNIGDKVYMRNTSTTTTSFNINAYNQYQFAMTGSIAASGDITSLINKNCTDTLVGDGVFSNLFRDCSSLTMPPLLPATTLTVNCYTNMFYNCSNLVGIPKLPSLDIKTYSYYRMFRYCSKIKLSTTQTGEYQTEYRIPTTGTGTTATSSLDNMFLQTGGTFTGTPTINTTYYTSNTLV